MHLVVGEKTYQRWTPWKYGFWQLPARMERIVQSKTRRSAFTIPICVGPLSELLTHLNLVPVDAITRPSENLWSIMVFFELSNGLPQYITRKVTTAVDFFDDKCQLYNFRQGGLVVNEWDNSSGLLLRDGYLREDQPAGNPYARISLPNLHTLVIEEQ